MAGQHGGRAEITGDQEQLYQPHAAYLETPFLKREINGCGVEVSHFSVIASSHTVTTHTLLQVHTLSCYSRQCTHSRLHTLTHAAPTKAADKSRARGSPCLGQSGSSVPAPQLHDLRECHAPEAP